jgi:hypothetical protein
MDRIGFQGSFELGNVYIHKKQFFSIILVFFTFCFLSLFSMVLFFPLCLVSLFSVLIYILFFIRIVYWDKYFGKHLLHLSHSVRVGHLFG